MWNTIRERRWKWIGRIAQEYFMENNDGKYKEK